MNDRISKINWPKILTTDFDAFAEATEKILKSIKLVKNRTSFFLNRILFDIIFDSLGIFQRYVKIPLFSTAVYIGNSSNPEIVIDV